jgi:hypothetical protein
MNGNKAIGFMNHGKFLMSCGYTRFSRRNKFLESIHVGLLDDSNGCSKLYRNVDKYLQIYTASYPKYLQLYVICCRYL